MQWLAEVCVKRPVFATMLVTSLVVVGAFSFLSLGVDLFPKIDDLFRLGKKAMAANVEEEILVIDRSADAADIARIGFDDRRRNALLGQEI